MPHPSTTVCCSSVLLRVSIDDDDDDADVDAYFLLLMLVISRFTDVLKKRVRLDEQEEFCRGIRHLELRMSIINILRDPLRIIVDVLGIMVISGYYL
mmetsp:Transcript_7515/g.11182  ORF Transcript_7515/g.11182 Transcript_7515/m.11182 type:complete len:97 (+) Transcript_7515:1494-1784(+)